jgi:hypothetical protein
VGNQSHAGIIAAGQNTETVMLDFVQTSRDRKVAPSRVTADTARLFPDRGGYAHATTGALLIGTESKESSRKPLSLLWQRGFVDRRGFAVFHRLLGKRAPRLRHSEQRQPAFGVGNLLGKLRAMSGVQAITRHCFVPQRATASFHQRER